jgi:predicted nucleotide-binding protein (sugar kinase/HSP70/actin superfamily)
MESDEYHVPKVNSAPELLKQNSPRALTAQPYRTPPSSDGATTATAATSLAKQAGESKQMKTEENKQIKRADNKQIKTKQKQKKRKEKGE